MKLRIAHNSIRIRIRKSELAVLQESGIVEEQVTFPNGIQFKFSLTENKNLEQVQATLVDDHLNISLPVYISKDWIGTNRVGIESNVSIPNNESLYLLIEKDFPCLDREEEDKSDTFWELAPEAPDSC